MMTIKNFTNMNGALFNYTPVASGIEVRPCTKDADGNVTAHIRGDGVEPHFWSVYLLDDDGLAQCVGDFKTERAADCIAEALAYEYVLGGNYGTLRAPVASSDIAEAAQCLWEAVLDVQRKDTATADLSTWERAASEACQSVGYGEVRSWMRDLAPACHVAWVRATELTGYDDCFDWEFVPAWLAGLNWLGDPGNCPAVRTADHIPALAPGDRIEMAPAPRIPAGENSFSARLMNSSEMGPAIVPGIVAACIQSPPLQPRAISPNPAEQPATSHDVAEDATAALERLVRAAAHPDLESGNCAHQADADGELSDALAQARAVLDRMGIDASPVSNAWQQACEALALPAFAGLAFRPVEHGGGDVILSWGHTAGGFIWATASDGAGVPSEDDFMVAAYGDGIEGQNDDALLRFTSRACDSNGDPSRPMSLRVALVTLQAFVREMAA